MTNNSKSRLTIDILMESAFKHMSKCVRCKQTWTEAVGGLLINAKRHDSSMPYELSQLEEIIRHSNK